jgi:myo-inositol 2-dehydrogenase/D-chiro-inositol 1-dehydrogenase
MDRYVQSYAIEMDAFIKALINDDMVPVPGREGLISVAIGLAAKKSALENRPVKLTEIL